VDKDEGREAPARLLDFDRVVVNTDADVLLVAAPDRSVVSVERTVS
jgi:hypothetical protein